MTKQMDFIKLIQQCLDRDYSVEIVKCGQYAKPNKPFLCRIRYGYGTALREHLVYGDNAPTIMREVMEYTLTYGFTQEQNRYGL